jgi:hypothetical protein
MDNFNGGLNPFSPDPQLSLKGKGLPWPVYLALGLAVAVGIGFAGLHAYQTRQKRKVHVAFMAEFADFEKNEVNAFWRCLFGKEGDARKFNAPEQLNANLEGALFTDPKEFPGKVQNECIPKALSAAKKIKDLNAPPEYSTVLENYGKSLSGLANSIGIWAEGAPKRFEVRNQENKVKTAGDAWNTTANPRKPDPEALRYDKFLHCAVPTLDSMKDGQELLEFIASKCVQSKTRPVDQTFLGHLRDECIPQAQDGPAKAPANFAKTMQKIAPDYDRETQAWDTCFKKMRKESKKDDLVGFDKTWVETVNASTEVRKIGKEQLKDE